MKKNGLKSATLFRAGSVIALGMAIVLSLGACQHDEPDNPDPDPIPEAVVFPDVQTIEVNADTTLTLTFSVNADWTLTSDVGWATFDGAQSVSGEAGDSSVEVFVTDENQTDETTVASLTLAAGDESRVIYILNRAPKAQEPDNPDEPDEPDDGEEHEIVVKADNEEIGYETEFVSELFDISDLLAHYDPVSVGYMKYEVGTEYNVTVTGYGTGDDWLVSPVVQDYDGKWCEALTDYYKVEGSTYDGSYPSTKITVVQDPYNLFYLVFQKEEGSDEEGYSFVNYMFVFYTDEQAPTKTGYEGIYVKNVSTYSTFEASTEAPEAYASAMASVVSDYGSENVGYLEYELNTSYIATVLPLDQTATWITENWEGYDSYEDSISSPSMSDTYSIVTTDGFSYSGKTYPGITVKVLQDPGTDFFYIAFLDDDDVASILFFYTEPEEESLDETVYTGFLVRDSDTHENATLSTTYSGDYDVKSIIDKYGATNVAYTELEAGIIYDIQPTPAQKDASQVWDAGVFDYEGNSCYDDSRWTITKNTSISLDGFSYPVLKVTVNEDPGTLFYVVFDSGYKYKSILFVTDVSVPQDSGDYDESAAFVVQDTQELTYYTVGSGDDFAGATSFSGYKSLATDLANTYNGAEVAYVKYADSAYSSTVTVASLPLAEAADWTVENFLDGDGDPASWSGFSYSKGSFHDYTAYTVVVSSAELPVYMVFRNTSTDAYKILIFTE